MTLDKKIIKEYNSSRKLFRRKYLCNAPFVNMYFNIHGDAAPCWLGFQNPDSYPAKSIKEIWSGQKFNHIRENIVGLSLEKTCGVCLSNLKNKNYVSVLSKAYDFVGRPAKYPLMMELELDNTCNLECIMCDGFLSSGIRKNREKKEAFKPPYDDAFIEQLNEFIPHLKEIRINGGEPFLSATYKKIFENIFRLNPSLNIVVATNGTQWNAGFEDILSRGRFNINISIDSLRKDTYERIRVNGSFDRVMSNFEKFSEYCKRRNTKLCMLVNPMRQNWQEMGDFVEFCNEKNILLWYNTIQHPEEHSLWALPADELEHIYKTLSQITFNPTAGYSVNLHNINVFKNLVQVQIYNWLEASKKRTGCCGDESSDLAGLFENRLALFIKDKGFDEEKIKQEISFINNKLDKMLDFIKERDIEPSGFYKLIKNIPVEMLYEELTSKPDVELLERLEKLLK